jgi:hypothetical protein
VGTDDSESNLSDDLKGVTRADGDRPPFSSQAYELLRDKIAEYVSDLVTESARIARRSRADDISAAHVQRAAEHLTGASRGRFYKHVGTIGGIMLGGALSNILTMTLENRYGAAGILITTGVAVIGTGMVAAHIFND